MRFEGKVDLLQLAVQLSGTHDGIAISDVAREFEISHRSAQRMMAAIRDRFPYALEEMESDGPAKRWRLRQATLRGLMDAEPVELMELEIAANRLRAEGAAPGRAEALARLLAKLRARMKEADLRRAGPDVEAMMQAEGTAIRPGPRPAIPAALLANIRHAVLASRRIRLLYGAEASEAREHLVEPLGLLHGQRAYLVAGIKGSNREPAMFRLDRIIEHALLPESFSRAAPFDLRAYAAQSFGIWREEPVSVCLRFAPGAARDAAAFHFHPTQAMEPEEDGALLVRFTAGGQREMCHHLLTWGDAVEVIEPAELRSLLASWARTAADHHATVPEFEV